MAGYFIMKKLAKITLFYTFLVDFFYLVDSSIDFAHRINVTYDWSAVDRQLMTSPAVERSAQ
jgi:hypothetical protein